MIVKGNITIVMAHLLLYYKNIKCQDNQSPFMQNEFVGFIPFTPLFKKKTVKKISFYGGIPHLSWN